jgi:truncated hemoglobin YjbI
VGTALGQDEKVLVVRAACVSDLQGNPMIAHLQLRRLRRTHFERWLQLWGETVADLCSDELASLLNRKAQMIGENLLYSITTYDESAVQETTEVTPGAL